jgi:hypothetical protein
MGREPATPDEVRRRLGIERETVRPTMIASPVG